ncbi:DUF1499 domain-containing protein [uncultured Paraglaciecola sp.]|uniref:DUF1499 domain-containing protein n=1 Tax=uncultured Paraglaciecola sp. TaxID=1765024 RepID=UPI0030DD08BD
MNKYLAITLLSFIVLVGCSGTIPKLGVKSGQLMPCPDKPNCVSTQATNEAHFIQAIAFSGSVQEAQDRLLQVLEGMERTKIIATEENYIRAEFTSNVFRFVDDAEFVFLSAAEGKTMIHLRSASRIGHSDFGVNRQRMEQIRNTFNSNS